MSESNSNPVHIEGTQFYRRSFIREVLRIVVITVVIFVFMSVIPDLIRNPEGNAQQREHNLIL